MKKYTIIRGEAVDVTEFLHAHPGGEHMLELGVGRDSTIMYESAHLRDAVADKALAQLPKADPKELIKQGITFDTVAEEFIVNTPRKSAIHNAIRQRVVNEVMRPLGKCVGAVASRGVPTWQSAAVLSTWAACVAWFMLAPGWISAMALGLSMSWIGTGVQHTANHGALRKSGRANYWLGLTDDVCVGGSSLVWRYHHQVSHHPYCNDKERDQDVHSSFPLMRLDIDQPLQWFHSYQYLYAFPAFSLLWYSVQMADFTNLFDACCYRVNFLGTDRKQIWSAVALKVVHYSWLMVLPYALHGMQGVFFANLATMVGGFWTGLAFIVSHNLESCKPGYEMSTAARGDWGRWQIETSASWGGAVGCFFTGGLNLQIEHHLFPCLPHHTHPAVAKIVKEECNKAGIRYNEYSSIGSIMIELVSFLKAMGRDAPSATQVVTSTAKVIAAGAAQAAEEVKNIPSNVAAELSEVSLQKTAKEMAKSAMEAKKTMEKDPEDSTMGMLKPMLLVVVYQSLQELYTGHWVHDKYDGDWEGLKGDPLGFTETTVLKPAVFTVLYLAMIFLGTRFMESRKPDPKLRKYMLTYNLYQVILNAWCVIGLIHEALVNHPHPFHFKVEQSSYKLAFLVWVHYNNKFVELFDTVFMVFNKKKEQVSFLHVYHHVLIMWSWWAVCRWGCGGIAWFSAMLNSAIHVAMYGYYTLAALKLPCPWKKMLTMMQMAQFCLCMLSAVYALSVDIYPFYLSLLNMWVMINMLVLFGNFYRKRYATKPAEAGQAATAKAKVA